MRLLIILSLSILLMISSLNAAYPYFEEFSYHEPLTNENSIENPTDGTFNIEHLPDVSDSAVLGKSDENFSSDEEQKYIPDTLDGLYKWICEITAKNKDELSKLNKELADVMKKYEEAREKIIKALEESQNGDVTSCSQNIQQGITQLEKAMHKFETRECPPTWLYRKRCIPQEMVQQHKEEIVPIFEDFKKFLLADEDKDDTVDICE